MKIQNSDQGKFKMQALYVAWASVVGHKTKQRLCWRNTNWGKKISHISPVY